MVFPVIRVFLVNEGTEGTAVSRFTGNWVDYSFVLLESTRYIFYSPYSVNVTVTNELLEVNKKLISAKTLCFMTFFSLILSLLPIQKHG